jgi:hypothetical protein
MSILGGGERGGLFSLQSKAKTARRMSNLTLPALQEKGRGNQRPSGEQAASCDITLEGDGCGYYLYPRYRKAENKYSEWIAARETTCGECQVR